MAEKRGRPKKVLSGHFLGVPLNALAVYNDKRASGTKHEVAVQETVATINTKYPDYPFRERDMRKLLAGAQPRDGQSRFKVAREVVADAAEVERLGLDPQKKWTRLTLSIAPAITHPRSNAKGPKKKRIY